MSEEVSRQQQLAAEADLLRALCTGGLEGAGRQQALERLARYRFCDGVHQAVFDALREMPSEQPAFIRQELPARLTRKGFPDADFETLFTPPASPPAQLAERVLAFGARRGS